MHKFQRLKSNRWVKSREILIGRLVIFEYFESCFCPVVHLPLKNWKISQRQKFVEQQTSVNGMNHNKKMYPT